MAYAAGRIGRDGMFLREHHVEPVSRARVLSQDRTSFYLHTSAGLR
jgi:hypothetical protein